MEDILLAMIGSFGAIFLLCGCTCVLVYHNKDALIMVLIGFVLVCISVYIFNVFK